MLILLAYYYIVCSMSTEDISLNYHKLTSQTNSMELLGTLYSIPIVTEVIGHKSIILQSLGQANNQIIYHLQK